MFVATVSLSWLQQLPRRRLRLVAPSSVMLVHYVDDQLCLACILTALHMSLCPSTSSANIISSHICICMFTVGDLDHNLHSRSTTFH
ncbi:hypothetical protein BD311DRAFT_772425 [Dichomitus squalens]|uniref:Uncharacterized protein n=1 Tax=Dichomitus squalens TaxID=114155 RepID=A0A4V2JYI0_9APHY|nr:hypothetical protein BD311DRAFT_772425 [Dichomitus squalens]